MHARPACALCTAFSGVNNLGTHSPIDVNNIIINQITSVALSPGACLPHMALRVRRHCGRVPSADSLDVHASNLLKRRCLTLGINFRSPRLKATVLGSNSAVRSAGSTVILRSLVNRFLCNDGNSSGGGDNSTPTTTPNGGRAARPINAAGWFRRGQHVFGHLVVITLLIVTPLDTTATTSRAGPCGLVSRTTRGAFSHLGGRRPRVQTGPSCLHAVISRRLLPCMRIGCTNTLILNRCCGDTAPTRHRTCFTTFHRCLGRTCNRTLTVCRNRACRVTPRRPLNSGAVIPVHIAVVSPGNHPPIHLSFR